jgi:nucleoid DNA-binding protein
MAKRSTKRRVTKKKAKRSTKRAAKRTAKRPARKASAAKKPAGRITPSKGKPRTKSEIYGTIADQVGISKKEVSAVFDTMSEMIAADLKRGSGAFNIPGMMKVSVRRKPAVKAHTRPDPFNPGQMMNVKAKPARNVVKIRPLKALKDMV